MLAVERFHDLHRVTDPVEEVGIAEGDVLRASRDLAADIFPHHLALDDAKRAVVYRHDGTVTAQVLAAPAGLGVAHDAGAVVGQGQMCVLFQRRQVVAIGHQEILTSERDLRLNLRQPRTGRAPASRRRTRLNNPCSNSPPRIVPTPKRRSRPALTGAYSPNPHRWAEGLSF